MKKSINILIIFLLLQPVISCKEKTDSAAGSAPAENGLSEDGRTEKQADGLTLLKGDFLYYADAAVLQTHREIYGVVIDDRMHELNEMVKEYKSEPTDMVPVEIRGKISEKPEGEEGWPLRVEIKEILSVSKPSENTNKIITIEE